MKKSIIKIALCLIAVLFAVSCGNNANSSTNPTINDTPKNLNVTYTFLNNGNSRIDVNTAANNNQIKKEVDLKITVSPTVSVDAKITKVTSTGSALEAADFTLSKTSSIITGDEIKITLSSTGIEKLKTAAKKTAINYTLTIEFTTASQDVENKTSTRDISISVMPLQEITKTQVETMIKNVGSFYANGFSGASFNTSSFQLNASGFNIDVTSNSDSSSTTYSAKNAAASLSLKIDSSALYNLGLNTPDYSSTTYSGKTANLVFKFTPIFGYCFANDIESIMTSGLKINLKLSSSSWKD
ncbi:hypothetical protein [Brachyspira sp. G79]|uniref:hypothetical protein n=1 Tax=Brachyspira sp. G79 TaxID=1358104 RepID=UPI000BBB8583|nr:hypothetical protein [Brachyspira sp. G79]PCG20478.1 hypothetical protein KQ44_11040 [Brachyspira sp. G79]